MGKNWIGTGAEIPVAIRKWKNELLLIVIISFEHISRSFIWCDFIFIEFYFIFIFYFLILIFLKFSFKILILDFFVVSSCLGAHSFSNLERPWITEYNQLLLIVNRVGTSVKWNQQRSSAWATVDNKSLTAHRERKKRSLRWEEMSRSSRNSQRSPSMERDLGRPTRQRIKPRILASPHPSPTWKSQWKRSTDRKLASQRTSRFVSTSNLLLSFFFFLLSFPPFHICLVLNVSRFCLLSSTRGILVSEKWGQGQLM